MNQERFPVHFIWIGKPMHKMICNCLKSCIEVYKDHPIYFWTEESVFDTPNHLGKQYMADKIYPNNEELSKALQANNVHICDIHKYDKHRIFTDCTFKYQEHKYRTLKPDLRLDVKSDAYRYAILEDFGGLYLDADFYHFKSYADILEQHDAALGQCDQFKHHGNAFIYASKPHHKYIEEIIDYVIAQSDLTFHRLVQIGPKACYTVRNKLIDQGYDIYSVPYRDYFAFNWEQTDIVCSTAHNNNEQPNVQYIKGMYGVHLWYDILNYWTNSNANLEFEFEEIPAESEEVQKKKHALLDQIAALQRELIRLDRA